MDQSLKPSEMIYEVLGRIQAEAELAIPADATPVEFLSAVYRDTGQPIHRRLRVAIECAPYVHPKLAVTASFDGKSFANHLEAAIARSGKALVIEGVSSRLVEPADGGMANPEGPGDIG
jgi:hypothetical protein